MMHGSVLTKKEQAEILHVSRATLYYHKKQPEKDWQLKCEIEEVLRLHSSYGSPRIAILLRRNKKPVERVMHLFGIKAYRRRAKKFKNTKKIEVVYSNMLITTMPRYRGHVWAADFTELWWNHQWVYVATVIDLYTREVVGVSIAARKGAVLTVAALHNALLNNARPLIFHSDNGSEYNAKVFVAALTMIGCLISRSAPGCPWENGYQESFYGKFKVELGDPSRFRSLGALIAAVYGQVHYYNTERIHTAFNMAPRVFAQMLHCI